MNNCLMLVDLQNDYFPGCDMELVGIEEAAANAQSDVHASFMAELSVPR